MADSARLEPQANDTAVRVAGLLALGIFLLFVLSGRGADLLGSTPRLLLVLLWPVALAAFWASGRALPVVVYLAGAGLALRLIDFPPGGAGGADTLAAVHEGIAVFLRGDNPYDHYYELTRPVGSPVPYPPAMFLLHLPGHLLGGLVGVQATQVAAAAGVLAVLTWLGRRVSWLVSLPPMAVYAGAPNLINLATDGSNDTAVGLVLVAAIMALAWALEQGADRRALIVAGVIGGLAIGTKQAAAPMTVVLAAFVYWRLGRHALSHYAAGGLGALLVISLPFLLDPLAYGRGLLSFIGSHQDLYGWNMWTLARGMGWPVWDVGPAGQLNVAASGLALAGAVIVRYRSLAGAVVGGLCVILVALLTARWTTYAYFAMLAPVVLLLPALAAWRMRPGEPAAHSSQPPADTQPSQQVSAPTVG